MELGYLGLSTDGLPFHYLSNDPHTDKRIPTQFASFKELRRLLDVVRKYDRVWQTTPIIENRLKALFYFTLTSGRLFGKPLKTSALSAMEMTAAPNSSKLFLGVAKLLNSKLLDGRLHSRRWVQISEYGRMALLAHCLRSCPQRPSLLPLNTTITRVGSA